ncbi:ornithine carbamoyltransferase [Gehongia tenuis]|uniref:Ornithine carbamoyltransferase n=1 Tax=Gehongia tenuis TaxID=2763655 RepID=A0A926HPH3_9FIRM|nr:ornithine carbamoyltransferase [Gehongia tenuis]MBC8530705.1 ornithine carbamoyltransferase [Gehongia tenuis]
MLDLYNYKGEKPFSQKNLVNLIGYDRDDILQILALALRLKTEKKAGIPHPLLAGRVMAMIFTKPSTRTRVSFETGLFQLGGHAMYISGGEMGLGTRETVYDVANVLGRMVDGIMIRTFAQADVEGLARHAGVPVINGLTDDFHPCQVLADMLTLYEQKGTLENLRLAYVGDGNNMANSLLLITSKLGVSLTLACPAGYEPKAEILELAKEAAKASGARIELTDDPRAAVSHADAVYTDTWASMGQEAEQEKRARIFAPYQVNGELMALAAKDAIFLHCLPAHRGLEVTDEVMDSPGSRVFEEAENRLHAQKAVMALLMGQG